MIPPRFWPPGIHRPAEILGENHAEIPPRFWPPGIHRPAEILGENHAEIPPRFWPPGIHRLAVILGENYAKITPRFWPPGNLLTAANPAGIPTGNPDGIENPGGQNLAAIPPGFSPGSLQDPAKIPVAILQGIHG